MMYFISSCLSVLKRSLVLPTKTLYVQQQQQQQDLLHTAMVKYFVFSEYTLKSSCRMGFICAKNINAGTFL